MTYNIHPIIVHFPIALLFIYSLIKIIPLQKWLPSIAWKDIRQVILFIGVIGAFASIITGGIAGKIVQPDKQLVEAHATFAFLTTLLYIVLMIGEISSIINTCLSSWLERHLSIKRLLRFIEKILYNKIISSIMAFIALISLILTGLLGGVMVYGLSADPMAGIVLEILGISL